MFVCLLVRFVSGKGVQSGLNGVVVPVIQNPLPIGKGRRSEGSLINFPPRVARESKAQPTRDANSQEALVSIGSHLSGKYTGRQAAFAIRRNTYFRRVRQERKQVPANLGKRKGRRREGEGQPFKAKGKAGKGEAGSCNGAGKTVPVRCRNRVPQSIAPLSIRPARAGAGTSHM